MEKNVRRNVYEGSDVFLSSLSPTLCRRGRVIRRKEQPKEQKQQQQQQQGVVYYDLSNEIIETSISFLKQVA